MAPVLSDDKAHAIIQMIGMYENVCTQLRTLKDDARVVSVYALYDCVSLILARMLKPYPAMKVETYNAKQLQTTTNAIDEDELNRKFIDFDKDFYGTVYLDTAMDVVKFDKCQKNLFWRKVHEHLTRKSPYHVTGISSDQSFDADAVRSESSFDPADENFISKKKNVPNNDNNFASEKSFDPEEQNERSSTPGVDL